jgi:hypothetical protein
LAVVGFASFHDPYAVTHGDGAFTLHDSYTVAGSMARQRQRGRPGTLTELVRWAERLKETLHVGMSHSTDWWRPVVEHGGVAAAG